MTSRIQVSLNEEMEGRARRRAADLGISLPEYLYRLVARDLGNQEASGTVDRVFDLGTSSGSEVARNKKKMIAEALSCFRHRR